MDKAVIIRFNCIVLILYFLFIGCSSSVEEVSRDVPKVINEVGLDSILVKDVFGEVNINDINFLDDEYVDSFSDDIINLDGEDNLDGQHFDVNETKCERKISKPDYILLMPLTGGRLYIGWRLDKEFIDAGYEIYRKGEDEGDYKRISDSLILDSTNFIDNSLEEGKRYKYFVRIIVDEGECKYEVDSDEVEILYKSKEDNIYLRSVLKKKIIPRDICNESVIGFLKIGDVDGDKKPDFLVSIDTVDVDGNRCDPIHIQVHKSDGTLLWYLNTEKSNDSAYYFQWMLFDIDGDGLSEAIGTYRKEGRHYLAIKEGLSGKTIREIDIPFPEEWAIRGPFHGIAYVNGKDPNIVVAWGTYHWEHGYVGVYDKDLNIVWKWEAPQGGNYGGAHSIRIADVDLDGRDEIIHSGGVLKDGRFLWRNLWNHYDALEIGDILPERPGVELFYCFEGPEPGGVRLVEAETGNTIWSRDDYFHCHLGWTDDIKSEYAGMESYVWYVDENGWLEGFLYSARGEIIERGNINYSAPIDWDGTPPKETLWYSSEAVDLVGDYREEAVNVENRPEEIIVTIFTNNSFNEKRRRSPWDEDHQYLLRHMWTGK